MSSALALRLLCRHSFASSFKSFRPPTLPLRLSFNRQFTTSPIVLAPKIIKRKKLTKKAAAAKARRKALKVRKSIYENEKMTLTDAIALLRAKEVASSNGTYELVIKTQLGRGMTVPKGRINLPREAKPQREEIILVFAEGKLAEEAKKAGAHIVGGIELVDGVVSRRYNATVIISTTPLIRAITPKLGRVLGPLGLMPSERRGTVTDDIAGYISRLRGTTEWRGDKDGTIRAPIAKLHFPVDDVAKNVRAFVSSVKRATGNTNEAGREKGKSNSNKKDTKPVIPITKILLSSPQGPGIKLLDM